MSLVIALVSLLIGSSYAEVVACFNVSDPATYCTQTGVTTGCFIPEGSSTNAACAQCNYPAVSDPVNGLPGCVNISGPNEPYEDQNSSYDLSYSCHEAYPFYCHYPASPAPTTAPTTPKPTPVPTTCPTVSFKTERTFVMYNKCKYPIWVGMSVEAEYVSKMPEKGGFKLVSGQTKNISVPNMESLNLWGRTNCAMVDGKFTCDTGECWATDNNNGADGKCCSDSTCNGPQPPESLVELTLAVDECSNDFYDVSAVDGYNVPVSLQPIDFEITEVIGYKEGDAYQCGAAEINTFDVNQKCPHALVLNGNATKGPESFNFADLSYCISPCKALFNENLVKNAPLKHWKTNSNAYDVLINNYTKSKLEGVYLYANSTKPLQDLLCCDCGVSTNACGAGPDNCYFGCSPFGGDTKEYREQECPNYGYKTSSSGFDSKMPLWPLLNSPETDNINPAYIYNDISPNAYSWQFDDQTSTFQCRNANYMVVFCHDDTTNNDDESGKHNITYIWSMMVVMVAMLMDN